MAAMTRTSTRLVFAMPTGSTSPFSRTRSTFACVRALMSPISSRKMVPPSACTNLPICLTVAPVNAPFSWPNSSDSISSSGMAAQLIFTNGLSARSPLRWISQATSSLPVPLSPVISTVACAGAALAIASRTPFIAFDSPTSRRLASTWCRRRRFSWRSRLRSMALRRAVRTRSDSSGFSRKSYAPFWIASTAVGMSP